MRHDAFLHRRTIMTTGIIPSTRPEIKYRLTADELVAVVDKVSSALPDAVEDEWISLLENMADFPPIAEEDEEIYRLAFWRAAHILIEGLVKHGLAAEPFVASIEVITGADRAEIKACTNPEQECLLRTVGALCQQASSPSEAA
jgi:hypothetical protein